MAHERGSSRSFSRCCISPFASLVALQLLPLAAVAQDLRVESEFQVNTYTPSGQNTPALASDADGDFVVVWRSNGQDGYESGIFARRFSKAGAAQASEFQVNAYTVNVQQYPSVASSASGELVVVWESYGQDGSEYGIFARRFSSAGIAVAGEFQVNAHTAGSQYSPAVAASGAGGFVVAWQSFEQDGSAFGIFAQRFSSSGVALAGEFQVNVYSDSGQRLPAVSADAEGDFVVAWQSYHDGSGYGVFARRFSSSGAALASEFQVNGFTPGFQSMTSVAAHANGDFVVAWMNSSQDGDGYGIFARRFSSAGLALTGDLQVNTYTSSDQTSPSVAAYAAGEFVVAWQSGLQDGSSIGIFAQRFSSTGAALASEFQVNTVTELSQSLPAVAADAGGDFVVAWQSFYQDDGSANGVFAQRFAVPRILDVDGDGDVTALTDGLLVLRYLFGFTGTTLTSGAVGNDCTRCDAGAIEPYLQTLT